MRLYSCIMSISIVVPVTWLKHVVTGLSPLMDRADSIRCVNNEQDM